MQTYRKIIGWLTMYEEWLEKNGYKTDKTYTTEELATINEDLLFEMARIPKNKTGLPYDIWLDPSGISRGNEHSHTPRLKLVTSDGEQIPIIISDNPKIPNSVKKNNDVSVKNFKLVKDWIVAYRKILLAHFFNQIDDEQATHLLKTTSKADMANKELDDILLPRNDGKIIWYYSKNDMLYQADVLDEKGGVITSSYAPTKHGMWEEVERLQKIYEIEKENINYLGEK